MLTPKFSCSQNANQVFIEIYTPAIRAAEVEISVDGNIFSFFVNPYFLRLQFPGDLVEDEESSANYDPSVGSLRVTLSKLVKGEDFPDLDLLSKLLAPVKPKDELQEPKVEVLESDAAEDSLPQAMNDLSLLEGERELAEAIAFDWQMPQKIDPEGNLRIRAHQPYGFLNLYSGLLSNISYTENEINELGSEAEYLSPEDRRKNREAHEHDKFDEDYYLSDLVDNEDITEIIAWKHPYEPGASVVLTPEENEILLRLPGREYLIDDDQTPRILMKLVSILFPYVYDSRTTLHDPTAESAWTVCALAPLFSALDTSIASSLNEVLRVAYRRMLSFPLHRSWALCERCRQDVADILVGGRRIVLKALLEMKRILEHHDVYYIYGKIWVEDYCIWIQRCAREEDIVQLGETMRQATISKDEIGWKLTELEAVVERSRQSDSDDESEDSIEDQRPTVM